MQKWMMLLVGLCFATSLSAQSTRTYYNRQGQELKNEKRAVSYRDVEPRPGGLFLVKNYTSGGVLLWQSSMKSLNPDVPLNRTAFYPDGKVQTQEEFLGVQKITEYYPSGQLKTQYSRDKDGLFDGELVSFYEKGQPLRKDLYKNGVMVSGTCYTETGQVATHYPFFVDASFNGKASGIQPFMTEWVYRNLNYPRPALNRMLQGVVMVAFTVKKNRLVGDVKVLKGVDPLLDEAAIAVVRSSPAWKQPAKQNNEPVDIYYVAPVAFVIK